MTTTIFALLLAVFAAYAAAWLRFRGRRIFLGLVLSASMFPGVATLTPLYDLFSRLGWIDQYPGDDHPGHQFRPAAGNLDAHQLPRRHAVGA